MPPPSGGDGLGEGTEDQSKASILLFDAPIMDAGAASNGLVCIGGVGGETGDKPSPNKSPLLDLDMALSRLGGGVELWLRSGPADDMCLPLAAECDDMCFCAL
mmetsp:Transcript_10322/g.16856  ORF Transcript_10322/g.16856 Transcript_10322/m.16856 type:complete len:103 (+) Transcript_10322:302-610(+)